MYSNVTLYNLYSFVRYQTAISLANGEAKSEVN